MSKHKRVDELAVGDRVITGDGTELLITKIVHGFGCDAQFVEWSRGDENEAITIEWTNGTSTLTMCLLYDDLVEIAQ